MNHLKRAKTAFLALYGTRAGLFAYLLAGALAGLLMGLFGKLADRAYYGAPSAESGLVACWLADSPGWDGSADGVNE